MNDFFLKLTGSKFQTSVHIVPAVFLIFIGISNSYGWSTQEHREMVPLRDDFDLSHKQFKVGRGGPGGVRDNWRYRHLLVAADFFQNWTDFRETLQHKLIDTRKIIDHGDVFGNSNHDKIAFLSGLIPSVSRPNIPFPNIPLPDVAIPDVAIPNFSLAGVDTLFPGVEIKFTFIDVLVNNRDHFQPYAQKRWHNNHREAIEMARNKGLEAALAFNGFADHFLADTFAAGHKIDYVAFRDKGGRSWVKTNHDRLSKFGALAKNKRGDEWRMFGDEYFHKMEEKGRKITLEAIALSIDDIFLAASGKNVPMIDGEYRAEKLIPILNPVSDVLDHGGCDFPPCGFHTPGNDSDMSQNFEPEMVQIPSGKFQMGCVSGRRCKDKEHPVHEVQITAFEMGKYEVTFAEWYACVSDGGCDPDTGFHMAPDANWDLDKQPAQWRSWDDAQKYVRWLSRKTGKQYRLPSESEWEYAARAGTSTPYSFNGRVSTDKANYKGNDDSDNYVFDDIIDGGAENDVDRGKALPVGSFQANPWGLHEVHGNVSEWTQDCWHDNYVGAPKDGSAWERGGDCSKRVWRGGKYFSTRTGIRSASRNVGPPTLRLTHGFRVARTLSSIIPVPNVDSDMPLTFAKLIIRSNLYDDVVYIDGKLYGSTPVNVELQARKHSIVISKRGYIRYEKFIELKSREKRTIRARLEKQPTRVSFKDVEYNCSALAERIGDFSRERQRTMSDLVNTMVGASFPEDISKIKFELGHTVSNMNVLICIDRSFPSEQKLRFSRILSYLAIGEYREGKCSTSAKRQFKKILTKSGEPMPIFMTFDSGVYESATTARKAYSGGIQDRGYMQIHTNRLNMTPFRRGIQSNIFSYDETDNDYSHSVSCLCLSDGPPIRVDNCINR